jgi:hypothetical protein
MYSMPGPFGSVQNVPNLLTGFSGSKFGGSCSNCVAVIGTGTVATALCSHVVSMSNISLLFFFDDG